MLAGERGYVLRGAGVRAKGCVRVLGWTGRYGPARNGGADTKECRCEVEWRGGWKVGKVMACAAAKSAGRQPNAN